VRDGPDMLWNLRRLKTPAEIDVMREAGRISVQAMIEVLKGARVGQGKYELSALFEYGCKRRGGRRVFDYNVIISSAENHPYLHYYRHNRKLVDGDFLVVDSGGDYRDYDSDVTISFPINGTFSPRQREIYEACKHDAGGSDKPKDRPLRAGEVFASDVFAVFPNENLGVRVENVVLITETGCENLSAGLPREISEIEALMKK